MTFPGLKNLTYVAFKGFVTKNSVMQLKSTVRTFSYLAAVYNSFLRLNISLGMGDIDTIVYYGEKLLIYSETVLESQCLCS